MSRSDFCAVALETNMVSDSLTLMDLFGTLKRGGFAAFFDSRRPLAVMHGMG